MSRLGVHLAEISEANCLELFMFSWPKDNGAAIQNYDYRWSLIVMTIPSMLSQWLSHPLSLSSVSQVSISSQLSLHYHWNYHYFHCYLYHFVSLSLQPSYCILSSQLYSRLLLASQLPLASYLSPSITIITPFNYRHNNYHYHYHNHYHCNHNIHYSYQYHRHELSSFL